MPTNNKIISLIVLAMILPEARGELVYDCTNQKNKVHSFSLEDVKECPDFTTQYDNGRVTRVQMISKSTQRFVKAKKSKPFLHHFTSFKQQLLNTLRPKKPIISA